MLREGGVESVVEQWSETASVSSRLRQETKGELDRLAHLRKAGTAHNDQRHDRSSQHDVPELPRDT